MKYISDKSFIENRNTQFMFNNCALCDIMRNNIAEQATGDNMAQAHCMLDT
jgi:hypothetical protein